MNCIVKLVVVWTVIHIIMAGKQIRRAVKLKFNGNCAYCGVKLGDRFHIDHLKPLYRGYDNPPEWAGTDDIENLMPACQRCNLWKKTFTIEQFRAEIKSQIDRLHKYSPSYNLAIDFNLIEENDNPVIFYFELCSKSITSQYID